MCPEPRQRRGAVAAASDRLLGGVTTSCSKLRLPEDPHVATRHPSPPPAGLHHAGDYIWARCILRLRRSLLPGRRGEPRDPAPRRDGADRKSTRLNSSHLVISYAVFCLKKKKR